MLQGGSILLKLVLRSVPKKLRGLKPAELAQANAAWALLAALLLSYRRLGRSISGTLTDPNGAVKTEYPASLRSILVWR
jgi:hypothetical protein